MGAHVVGQRPLQRGDAAEGDELVDLAQLGSQGRRRHHVAGLPAGDVVGLAERADHEGALVQLLVGQHAGVLYAVEHQVLVDLVADQVDLALADQGGQLGQLRRGNQSAAGVVRAVEDDQAGARADRVLQPLPVDGEVRQRQRHVHAAPAGQFHRGLVAVVAGIEDDHLVARADQRLHRAEDRLGGAGSDGHLAVHVHAAAVAAGDLRRHLLAQGRQAGHRCVLVVPGHHVAADRLAQRLRAVEVGKALGQVERAGLRGELGHGGEDGGADVGQFADDHRSS
ncbi:hypothetical protein D3C80_1028580 [compost metagenome]